MTTDAEAIGLPFNEAIEFFRGKARVPTEHWYDVWRTAHSHAFMVAGATSDALLADFQAAIQKALEKGTTLAEFRKDFDSIVQKHGWAYNGTRNWRTRIIYETNLSMAYAAGGYAQLTMPSVLAAFPYWQYKHSGSRNPRKQHLAWDGLILRADDPFWRTHYPPNGWRCGCRVEPMADYDLRDMGKNGPDKAPPIELRTWRNPKTGELHHIPVGIDPGFDYNPGMAWKEGPQALPVKAPRLRPEGAPGDPIAPGARNPLPQAPEALSRFLQAGEGSYEAGRIPARVAKALQLPATEWPVTLTTAGVQASIKEAITLSFGEWATIGELVTNPTVALHKPGRLVQLKPSKLFLLLRRSGRVMAAELLEHRGMLFMLRFWRMQDRETDQMLAGNDLVYGDADNLDKGSDAE